VVGKAPEGLNPRRATARGPGGRTGESSGERTVLARTDSRGEQGFEAGGLATSRRARRERAVVAAAIRATGWWTDDLDGRGSSRPRPLRRALRASRRGDTAGGRRAGETGREILEPVAPEASLSTNSQGSKRPSEGGTASREGKALQGKSQGRLRHETGPRSSQVLARRRARSGQPGRVPAGGRNRRGVVKARGRNRAGRWRSSLSHDRVTPAAVEKVAPGSASAVGTKNPRRGGPDPRARARGKTAKADRAVHPGRTLKRSRTPREGHLRAHARG
jgi:hypothetical protein